MVTFTIVLNILYITKDRLHFKTIQTFKLDRRPQAIVASENYLFVIYNTSIDKYDKKTLNLLDITRPRFAKHLNGGVVKDNLLYCVDNPLADRNHIYTWDIDTMHYHGPVDIIDLQFVGTLSSIDYYHGAWWLIYSFYHDHVLDTHVVMFDINWNSMHSWVFPSKVLNKLKPYSISSGSWKNNIFYCTGHQNKEIYMFKAYKNKNVLTYMGTVNANISGQGLSWDRHTPNTLYGLDKDTVVIMKQSPSPSSL
uniref:Uncharacterized protein n=1 Tax=Mimivirus LCMiAC01 TaxID=2506608 RepID=A0A481YZU3_9VIRU|nr:MAG: hypothetical protein LCMiAC01_00010 [Mimivirus LCMiAC01]